MKMTTKPMRYPPMTLLEVSDQAGGRKVVMVCKDGVTYWDVLDAGEATPIVIHPALEPKELGDLVTYCQNNGLVPARDALIALLRERGDARLDSDPLFVVRALWFIRSRATGDNQVPTEEVMQWAIEQSLLQERKLVQNHQVIERYCAATQQA
ncbi:MAG: hypothetical protein WC617_12910 [Rhodanobacter sp.]